MKHSSATKWCLDSSELNVYSFNKRLCDVLLHIDTQDRGDSYRVQGIISIEDFANFMRNNPPHAYQLLISYRGNDELLITFSALKKES